MSTVLVTGGTGTLGRVIIDRLIAENHNVRVLSRNARPALPSCVRIYIGDLLSNAILREALQNVDIIVHLATDYTNPQVVDFDSTKNLLTKIDHSNITSYFLYLSLASLEDIQSSAYAQAKLDVESLIQSSNLSGCIVRSTPFYNTILSLIQNGAIVNVNPNLQYQPIDVNDVADYIMEILSSGVSEEIRTIAGPELLTYGESVDTFHRVCKDILKHIYIDPKVYDANTLFEQNSLSAYDYTSSTTWETFLRRRFADQLKEIEIVFENNIFGNMLRKHWIAIPSNDNLRMHDITDEEIEADDRFWTELCGVYLISTPNTCAEIRESYYRHARLDKSFPLGPLGFATRCAKRIETHDSVDLLRSGLAAVSIDGARVDYRDTYIALRYLRVAALKCNIDPNVYFNEVALLSDPVEGSYYPKMTKFLSNFENSTYWQSVVNGNDPFLKLH